MGSNKRKQKPKGFWRDISNIAKEANPYIQEVGGLPNCGYFKRIDRLDIMCGIHKYGGFQKVADELNIPLIQTVVQQKNCYVPLNYWKSWDNFIKELEPIINQYGTVPSSKIVRSIKNSLDTAFRYHGGYQTVRNKLGLPRLNENERTKQHDYWGNKEKLLLHLQPIIKEYGNIPSSLILRARYGYSLGAAIYRHYGGYVKLRKSLGLPEHYYSKEKTHISIYRDIGLKAHGEICFICGYIVDVEVHHIDRNRLNNASENLIVLCPNHHKRCHTLKLRSLNEITKYKLEYQKKYKAIEYGTAI